MIRALAIDNFKSFRQSRVAFGPLTVIVGANGSGKSNLFDVLRFLKAIGEGTSIRDAIEGHVGSGPTATTAPGIRGGAGEITNFGSDSSVFSISVEIGTNRTDIHYSISVDATSYRVVDEELSSIRDHPGPYVYSTSPTPGPLLQDSSLPMLVARFYKGTRGLNPRRNFSPFESILSQFRGRSADSLVNERIADRARAELAAIRPLELRPEVLRQYAPLGRFELGEHGENFAAVVWMMKQMAEDSGLAATEAGSNQNSGAKDRYEGVKAWLNELTPHPIADVEVPLAPTGEVIFALREAAYERPITARSLSDGTLRFAALAVAVWGSPARRTLLVEELENGIHPARLALLIRMLEQATRESKNLQVLTTTHAPAVLDYVSDDTRDHSLAIGWDTDNECSHVVALRDLAGVIGETNSSLGALQAEGWLRAAADR